MARASIAVIRTAPTRPCRCRPVKGAARQRSMTNRRS